MKIYGIGTDIVKVSRLKNMQMKFQNVKELKIPLLVLQKDLQRKKHSQKL